MNKTGLAHQKKNGRRLPVADSLSADIVQAVIEDAVLEAAADIAALTATLEERQVSDTPVDFPEALTSEEARILDELLTVPLLGPSRSRALADAGFRTLRDLHIATIEQLSEVKGIGSRNAGKIKDWLAENTEAGAAPTRPDALPAVTAVPEGRLQGALADLDRAAFYLKTLLLGKGPDKRLEKQLDKMIAFTGDLPGSAHAADGDALNKLLRRLSRISADLTDAAASKLANKDKEALRLELKKSRQRLKKTLNG